MIMKQKSLPLVSVIIPTYHDWDRLQLCLDALKNQTYPREHFEIIVVNNDPKDTVPLSLDTPENCVLLVESKPGSYAARNAALSIAKGEILAFTDSDCCPKQNWLEVAVNYLNMNTEVERIGGEIALFSENKKLNWFEIYETLFAFPQNEFVKTGMAATGNMITRKKVFDIVGVFNDSLMSGGDGEWGRRAQKEGAKIIYLKDCIVFHPTRYDSHSIKIKNSRLAGGHLSIAREKGKKAVFTLLLKTVLPPYTAIKRALSNKEQPLRYKLIAIIVYYYLKMIAFSEILKILMGISVSERN